MTRIREEEEVRLWAIVSLTSSGILRWFHCLVSSLFTDVLTSALYQQQHSKRGILTDKPSLGKKMLFSW